MTQVQTNAVSVVFIFLSAYIGSKITENKIIENFNIKNSLISKEFCNNIRKSHNNQVKKLEIKITELTNSVKTIQNSEAERVMMEIQSEKLKLIEKNEDILNQRSKEIEKKVISDYIELQNRMKAAEITCQKLEKALHDQISLKENERHFEKLSLSIIEENVPSLGKEFNDLLPLVRQYIIMDSGSNNNQTIFKYFLSHFIQKVIFTRVPVERHDIIDEIGKSINMGNMYTAIYLFNHLRGWPRLILKDLIEKCRDRLEYKNDIQVQLYTNKL